jgi:hypothetical protein
VQVAGTSGKVKLDGGSDDEGVACAEYGTAIQEALGRERNAEVLSKLYVARSDMQYVVRNTALHIWKTIVVNTPRTLQEILPALMAEVISALADPGGRVRSPVCASRVTGRVCALVPTALHSRVWLWWQRALKCGFPCRQAGAWCLPEGAQYADATSSLFPLPSSLGSIMV